MHFIRKNAIYIYQEGNYQIDHLVGDLTINMSGTVHLMCDEMEGCLSRHEITVQVQFVEHIFLLLNGQGFM